MELKRSNSVEEKSNSVEEKIDARAKELDNQQPSIKRIKCGECAMELMFERNMALHYSLDHRDIIPPPMRTWNEDNDILEQHHEISLINLTMNQIHNRRTEEDIRQAILDQVEPRYYFKGSLGSIEGLMYMNSPINETLRPFSKNFKITRMVVRACLGFLNH